MSTRLSGLLCLACILLSIPFAVNAQIAATASLDAPNTDAFPHIETYLDVHDSSGNFVHHLQLEHVRVLEDEIPATVTSLQELRPGVQFVAALNPGPSLGVRDSQGISRYDQVKAALESWALSRQGTTLDDLSLLITNGPGISHVSDPLEWLGALEADQTDARSAEPNIDILFQAVTLAADTPPRRGMGRAVLFVTPPPETQAIPSLEEIFARAQEQGVSISVWMVASSGSLGTQGAQRLIELTENAGGQVFTFTGTELLPNPETYLELLRSIYHLVYESKITSSGAHQFVAQVQVSGELVSTAPQSFEIDIRPPIPTFISPPIQIVRLPDLEAESQEGNRVSLTELQPTVQTLQVVFDFPEGRLRPVVYSALYVDGVLTEENLQPPFDQFTWDLGNYATAGTHQLQVQAEDSLGLVGSSVEIPVSLMVELPAENPWIAIQQNIPLLVGLIVTVAGAILILVLVLGGRLTPRVPGITRNRRRRSDPVTQPLSVKENPSRRRPHWVNRLQRTHATAAPRAYAFLSPISETDALADGSIIPITSNQITIGIDPSQASLVLDHPSIESLHACLARNEDGTFRLVDEGSIAGTWINYTPVSREGSILEHGDLIHIGRLGFRFTLREPQHVRKPVVTLISIPEESIGGSAS
jgi:hypothetical protein